MYFFYQYNLTKDSFKKFKNNPLLLLDHDFKKIIGKVIMKSENEDQDGILVEIELNEKYKEYIKLEDYFLAPGFIRKSENEVELLEISLVKYHKDGRLI